MEQVRFSGGWLPVEVPDLVASLEHRVQAYIANDAGPILAAAARQEAAALLDQSTRPNGGIDVEIVELLARTHLVRSGALPEDQRAVDLNRAMRLYGMLLTDHPHLVPESLRRALAGTAEPPAEDADDLAGRVLANSRGDAGEAEKAVVALNARLLAMTDDDPERPRVSMNLGALHLHRYLTAGSLADLERAEDLNTSTTALLAPGHPRSADAQSNLGIVLVYRYLRTHRLERLEAAIAAGHAAVNSSGDATHLQNLAWTLLVRADTTGAFGDLAESIDLSRRALAALEVEGRPAPPGVLANLGQGLAGRAARLTAGPEVTNAAQRTRADADTREAIAAYRAAIDASTPDDPDRPDYVAGLDRLLQPPAPQQARSEAMPPGNPPLAAPPGRVADPWALLLHATLVDDRAALEQAITLLQAGVERPLAPFDRDTFANDLGRALRMRSERTGSVADLDAAAQIGNQCVHVTAERNPHDPALAARLGELAATLLLRYRHLGQSADLGAAIDHSGRAVALSGTQATPHLRRLEFLSIHAAALGQRYLRTGAHDDLTAALDAHRQSLASTPPRHPLRPLHLHRYASDLLSSDAADGDRAVAAAREAVALTAPGHPHRGPFLSGLSEALQARAINTTTSGDRHEAEAVARQAVAVTPPGHAERATVAMCHALALVLRHEQTGILADLNEAVAAARFATGSAATPMSAATCLRRLGTILHQHHESFRDRGSLDEALRAVRRAIEFMPDDHPAQISARGDLGVILLSSIRSYRRPEDIDEALAALREAAAAPTTSAMTRLSFLEAQTIALMLRFDITGEVTSIDEALGLIDVVLSHTPPDHPARPSRLTRRADLMRRRSVRFGDPTDLDTAIRDNRAAMTAAPAGSAEQRRLSRRLAVTLVGRFDSSGDRADLDEAVALARAAADAPNEDPELRSAARITLADVLRTLAGNADEQTAATALRNAEAAARQATAGTATPTGGAWTALSLVLLDKARRYDDRAALHEAVDAARRAASASPTPDMHMRLGIALHHRYDVLNDSNDLRQAIDALRQARQGVPDDFGELHIYECALAQALLAAGIATTDRSMLDEAIDLYRRTAAASVGNPEHAEDLASLGDALHTRYETGSAPQNADLDEAINTWRTAVAMADAASRTALNYRVGLANALLTRDDHVDEQHGDRPDDLAEAVTLLDDGIRAAPNTDEHLPGARHTLGNALHRRYRARGRHTDLDAAARAWHEASAPDAPPPVRRIARIQLARATAELHGLAAAADLYTEAVEDLTGQVRRGTQLEDHQRATPVGLTTVGREAASCAISAGRPEQAVDLLERSRSMFWQHVLDTRTDLSALTKAAPSMAADLVRLRSALDSSDADARMHAARRFDELITEVRALPPTDNFPDPGSFLQRESFKRLHGALGDRTVVIINMSRWRCDALIVTTGGVRVVELTDLSQDEVHALCLRYLAVLLHDDKFKAELAIIGTLRWLWDHITEPILTALAPAPDRPRVWWSPTGMLGLLPLHAAGHHHEPGRSVLDRVRSSYTPTLRILAEGALAPTPTVDDLLMVEMAETPDWSPLPQARIERQYIETLELDGQRTVLAGPAAGRVAILTNLASARWLHAACHGTQNLAEPASGGLVPYDWQNEGLVTVSDVSRAWLPSAAHAGEFAFLGACKTAVGGIASADEAITVAAALQASGWRHVIATLWTAYDESAAEITKDVYGRLVHDGKLHPDRAGEVLDEAVIALRRKNLDVPSKWAPFIHSGP
ncbi:CHAT domain-containing protein [Streptomyces sp. NPDC088747]|uniref:CHAT domain-containing protein n=1 Tax=Streptomyces sp. NPDC088747 TaxID=3365886 RepID=UPI00380974D0